MILNDKHIYMILLGSITMLFVQNLFASVLQNLLYTFTSILLTLTETPLLPNTFKNDSVIYIKLQAYQFSLQLLFSPWLTTSSPSSPSPAGSSSVWQGLQESESGTPAQPCSSRRMILCSDLEEQSLNLCASLIDPLLS